MAINTVNPSSFLEKLLGSPTGQALVAKVTAEEQAAVAARRKELAAALVKLDADREREAPALQKLVADAVARNRAAWEALRASEQAIAEAQRQAAGPRFAYDRARQQLEWELLNTAPPQIDAFVHELVELEEAARQQGTTSEVDRSWTGAQTVRSNHGSVMAHLAGLKAAREAAVALKLEALDAKALAARLDGLRKSVPPVSMTLVAGGGL